MLVGQHHSEIGESCQYMQGIFTMKLLKEIMTLSWIQRQSSSLLLVFREFREFRGSEAFYNEERKELEGNPDAVLDTETEFFTTSRFS